MDSTGLGDVAALATALGLLDAAGAIDPSWFRDPGRHVSGMLRDPGQRAALVQFVEDAIGDTTAPVTDDPTRSWVPLLSLTSGCDMFLVLEPNSRGVVVAIGLRIAITTPAIASAELRVPLVRVNTSAGSGVDFLPGSTAATDVADATAQLRATVTVADATLNSVGVTASVPLTPGFGTPAVGIAIHGLRLPGSAAALDVSLDSASALGPELTHLLAAILQAEAGDATGGAREILGLFGLLPAGGAIPSLPVAAIITDGVPALIGWVESVAGTPSALTAWLGHLAQLIGATPVASGIAIAVGSGRLALMVDVRNDATGGLVIAPTLTLSHSTPGLTELGLSAEAELAEIRLGPHAGVRALPSLNLAARFGADTGTIVDVTLASPAVVVAVGALRAGLALDAARKPVFVLAADRVEIGPDAGHLHHHDVLDLTSPDSLAEVATAGLDAVLAGILAGLGPVGTELGLLLGLSAPAGAPAGWPSLSLPAFFSDPLGAVAAFYRDVLALGPAAFADLLAPLPGLLGVSATIVGAGTRDAPWSLAVATGVSVFAWQDGTPAVLHLGARAAPAIPPLGGADGPLLGLAIVVEALAVALPAAGVTSTPIGVSIRALPSFAVEVSLSGPGGQPLTFGTGYSVSLQKARLTLALASPGGLAVSFDLPGATVTVAGVATPLGPITLGPGGRFSLPLDLPWALVAHALRSALSAASPGWVQGLPDLLGLGTPTFDQAGGIPALLTDPFRFLRSLLAGLLASVDGDRVLAMLASSLAALTSGPVGTGFGGGSVGGSGGPADPFVARVGESAAALEVALWLEPDGPASAAAGLGAVLLPEALARWLDDDAGVAPLDLAAVAKLLGHAADRVPAIARLLAGRDTLAAGLAALATRITGGDGLLAGGLPDVPGATTSSLAGVTHGQLAARVDLTAIVGAALDPLATVYVTGPLAPPWPGLDARTFDLTQAGLAPTAFDVSRAEREDGPWHVRLPARAACPGADADGQLVAQAARLQRVIDAVASRHPAQVTLVAQGSAGQAARLVSSNSASVAKLVLLGVPADGLSLDVLDVPPAADALQLLLRLLPAPDPTLPDDADLATARAILGALGGAYESASAPTSDFVSPRTPGSLAPDTWSVRGTLDGDTVNRALAAVVRAGLAAAWPAAAAPAAPPTALRGGLRMSLGSAPATSGPGPDGIAVDVTLELGLGLVALNSDSLGPARLTLDVALSRPGGWLSGGPQGVPAALDASRTPSLRRAALRASVDLDGTGGVRAQIVLDEVDALDVRRDRLVLGDGGDPVTPEARVLLGRLAATVGSAASGSRLAGVLALLRAAGLTDPSVAAPAIGLSVDAITRLAIDPVGQLNGALGSPAARADVAAAVRALVSDTTSAGSRAALQLGGMSFAVDLSTTLASFRLSTAGLDLPGGLSLVADVTIDAHGGWSGSAALAVSGPSGPAGRPSLRLSSGPTVELHLDGGLAGLPAVLPLWPLPTGGALAAILPVGVSVFAATLVADLLRALRDLDPPRIDPILGYLGLATGSGATTRIRLPVGLVADPGGWLAGALGTSAGLDADSVQSLADAVRETAGLPAAAHGVLPLPFGITFAIAPDAAGGLRLSLGLGQQVGSLQVSADAGVTLRSGAPAVPHLRLDVGPSGHGGALRVALDGPALTAGLALSGGNSVAIYPSCPGLGVLAAASATAALPLVLDQLEASGPTLVASAVAAARAVLGLGAPHFDGAQLRLLAGDPAGELERRLAANGAGALARLAPLLAPALPTGATLDTSDSHAVVVSVGAHRLTLRNAQTPASFSAAVDLAVGLTAAGVGFVGAAHVLLDGTGLRLVDVTIGIDPAHAVALGPVAFAPFARVAAGNDAAARVELGIAVNGAAQTRALVATLLIGPPLRVSLGTRTGATDDATPDIGEIVTGFVIPLVAEIALADAAVAALLARDVWPGTTLVGLLEGVLLAGGHFDPAVLDPDLPAAVRRLLRLAGNVAQANPSVSIGSNLRVAIARPASGDLGLEITVDPGQRVALTSGDLVLSIEVDSTWTAVLPGASPGLSVLVLRPSGAGYVLASTPTIVLDGVGLRVSRDGRPLLDSGLRIGSVAVYGLLAIDQTGVSAAGGKLELADLGVAVANASGGANGVAQGVLGQTAAGGGDNTPLRPQFSPSLTIARGPGTPVEWSLRAGDGDGPWWLVIQRSFGPLHIEQIGFGVDQAAGAVHGLRVLFDGGLSLLGLSIEVEELSVGAHWPSSTTDPPLTDPHAWSIDLAGLAVGYDGGGISMAGALRRRGNPPDYEGVLIAHLGPYGLTAFGGYGQFLAPDGGRYTSLFVLAGITAPIGGPPAFFVTGLGGGAGINRRLVLPESIDDFANYPLVAAIDPHSTLASDPQHALDELSAAFPPERGTFWFAAGVSFTSFALVDVTAVIAVSVGDGFQLALLGIGRMGLPTPYAPIVQVELALLARMSTKEGLLLVQAQLTHNSWLLTADCRLTGGFAFASFFGTNPNAGQFVLTIGGYHPSFHHAGYPDVPRVGYIWNVAGVLTISGQSYFALTSEAIMAGTSFKAALDLGFLWASLTLGIDAIVYFDPFKLVADGYAAIAAGVTIDIDLGWFGHIRVSLSFHLGATVHIEGPDFRGSATIDLDVTSATIAFGGDRDNSTGQLSWSDFSGKYLTAGGASALSAMPQRGQLQGTPTTGAGTTPTGELGKPWKFAAEWSLSVATTAATTNLHLPPGRMLAVPFSPLADNTVAYSLSQVPGIASMAVDALVSTLSVTLTGSAGPAGILGPAQSGEGLRVTLVTAPLPKGVWAASPHDVSVPSGDTITAGTGFVLLAPATVEGRTGEIPVNQIDPLKPRKPLPFAQESAARPARQSDDANAAGFAAARAAAPGQSLAAALVFLQTGPLSSRLGPLAVAAFGRDRLAPPQLGLLTEGMVSPATPTPQLTAAPDPAAAPVDTTVHAPVLVAMLDGAIHTSKRPLLRTTVSRALTATPARASAGAAAMPRVRAPTMAAVNALIDPAFAASLIRVSPTAIRATTGLRSADGGPVVARAGAPAELRRGPVLPPADRARLDGSLAALLDQGLTLRPGDLALAELPNAARDLDPSATRHRLSVSGDAAVRVVALSVTGTPLLDVTGVELNAVMIPQHTSRVALWCVGGDGTRAAGLAGWHDISRLPQVGARTLLGADAVINGAGHARRGPAAVSAASVPARDAIAGTGLVTTQLPSDTRVVVVGVDPIGEDRDLSGLTFGISGATRATDPAGAPLAPTLVTAGVRLHLVFAVVAPTGADAVLVTVASDDRWRIAGVLGGPGDVAGTAAELAASGVSVAAPLLRSPVGSAQVSWTIPEVEVS